MLFAVAWCNSMFRPIPKKILKHTVTLKQCTGVDRWEKPEYSSTTLSKVCVQPVHKQLKTRLNTEVTLTGLVFIDARLSLPKGLLIEQLQEQSLLNGAPMVITFNGLDRTVETVDVLYDDEGVLHHYEVGLV